jgi:hypothetical protein
MGFEKPDRPGERGMGLLLRIGTAATASVILLAPAIWNRFPLLQYDTGGYLARWYEGYLVPCCSPARISGRS